MIQDRNQLILELAVLLGNQKLQKHKYTKCGNNIHKIFVFSMLRGDRGTTEINDPHGQSYRSRKMAVC